LGIKPPLLNDETIFYILDLTLFFFHNVATSTVTRPTIGGTGLTTVLNTIFFVGFSHDGATANRT
jgi:hypothetical protein